jgi:hypothetical protein
VFWFGLLVSIILAAFGGLSILAGGISDAPTEGASAAQHGLILAGTAIVLIVLLCVARHNNWLPQ